MAEVSKYQMLQNYTKTIGSLTGHYFTVIDNENDTYTLLNYDSFSLIGTYDCIEGLLTIFFKDFWQD